MMVSKSQVIGVEAQFYTPHLERLVNMLADTPGTGSKDNLTIKEEPKTGQWGNDGSNADDPLAGPDSGAAADGEGGDQENDNLLAAQGYAPEAGARVNRLLAGLTKDSDDPCNSKPEECLAFPVAGDEDGEDNRDRVVYIPRFYQCRTPSACIAYNHSARVEECERMKVCFSYAELT
jgi:hypothetical protein